MIEFIFYNASRILTEYDRLLIDDHEKALLNQMTLSLENYKHINVYAMNAAQQINDKLKLMTHYLNEIGRLLNRLKRISAPDVDIKTCITQLTPVFMSLRSKNEKLLRLKAVIPEGMLDVKRALIAVEHDSLSDSLDENLALKEHFAILKDFMRNTNKKYNRIIKQGGSIQFILFETTRLYWMILHEYKNHLIQIKTDIDQCTRLTKTGHLVQRCIDNAQSNIPSTEESLKLLSKANNNPIHIDSLMSKIGFSSVNGRRACAFLRDSGKPFFHMPHNESMYHIDYDPTSDLSEAAGNCFGESMMFINALSIGCFKRLCPEAGIINYQLEQTRPFVFQKITLGVSETVVSADSLHQSLQWEDAKNVLINNPLFKPGDICGMSLSMNEYTQAQKGFKFGHCAVLAKLDMTQSMYKYIVFEKGLGIFGLVDDVSLEYIFSQQIMTLYEEVNYSNIKLIKYGEASAQTYQFISKIKPIIKELSQQLSTTTSAKPNAHSFFDIGQKEMKKDSCPFVHDNGCMGIKKG